MRKSQIFPQFRTTETSPENCEEDPMSKTWSETAMQNILLYIVEPVVEECFKHLCGTQFESHLKLHY